MVIYLGGQNQSLLPSLSLQDLGLGEKYFGLDEQYLGLDEKMSGPI